MFLRVVIASILGLYGWTAYSFEGWDQVHFGSVKCGGWEWAKQNYEENPEDLFAQDLYATCLFIKGKHTNNPAEVDTALYMLYTLADNYRHITSNNFLGMYLSTGGDLTSYGKGVDNLDRSIDYYQTVLAEIALRGGHYAKRGDDYELIEYSLQMELQSHMTVPYLYLVKYDWGARSDTISQMLQSPNYTGNRDFKIYPEYAQYTEHSLTQMQETAQSCLSVPLKEYFKPQAYHLVRELCQSYKQQAEILLELELQRRQHIVQDYCRDIESPDCPVHSLMGEIVSTSREYHKKDQPLREAARSAMWE